MKNFTALGVIAAIAVLIVVTLIRQDKAEVAELNAGGKFVALKQPPVIPMPPSLPPGAEMHAPAVSTPPEIPVAEPVSDTELLEVWTEESLGGTTWKSEHFDSRFAVDGTWYMGQRAAAKWVVEGSRIKLYDDDTDEVHYIDIRGNELLFEGKPIGELTGRM
jgi:hypothetical protein